MNLGRRLLIKGILASSVHRGASLSSLITSLVGLGDSIMVGQNCKSAGFVEASDPWTDATDSLYNQLLAAFPTFTSNDNKGSRGSGLWTAIHEAGLDATYGLSRRSYLSFAGYNDYRNLGTSTSLANRALELHSSMMALHCLKNWTCGDTFSNKSGAHFYTTVYTAQHSRTEATGGHFTAHKAGLGGTGAWIEYTFNGDGVVVGIGCNPETESPINFFDIVNISVDGNIVETLDTHRITGAQPGFEGFGYFIYRMYTGFGPGAHTVRVQTQTERSAVFVVDGIGEIHDTVADFQPFVCMHTMKMSAAGYLVGGATLDNGSDAAADQVNSQIDAAAAIFNAVYPGMFHAFPTNSFINPLTDFDVDLIHPVRVGHDKIAAALINLYDS